MVHENWRSNAAATTAADGGMKPRLPPSRPTGASASLAVACGGGGKPRPTYCDDATSCDDTALVLEPEPTCNTCDSRPRHAPASRASGTCESTEYRTSAP